MTKKVCRICSKEKAIEEFSAHSQMKDGRINSCKHCVKERSKQRAADIKAGKRSVGAQGRQSGSILKKLYEICPDTGCWLWLLPLNKKTGYGKKQWHNKTMSAHRWMYEQKVGPIPDGKVVDHKCKNRGCVNPEHLQLVKQYTNVRRGVGTKLTFEQAQEIKAKIKTMKWGGRQELADEYGVSPQLISDIKAGRAWRDDHEFEEKD